MNEINTPYSQSELTIFEISKFRFKINYSFYILLLLLLNDISLNLGAFNNPQVLKQKESKAFSNRELCLVHLSIQSLLLKIYKLWDIAIGILKSKLDRTVFDPDIQIENYKILRFNSYQCRGVTSYIRSNIRYVLNSFLPYEIKNMILNALIPHEKWIVIWITYRPLKSI